MLGLEGWMDIRSLHQQGLSISSIARREDANRRIYATTREIPRNGGCRGQSPYKLRRHPTFLLSCGRPLIMHTFCAGKVNLGVLPSWHARCCFRVRSF
jgi:hypothetical protein